MLKQCGKDKKLNLSGKGPHNLCKVMRNGQNDFESCHYFLQIIRKTRISIFGKKDKNVYIQSL